MKRFVNFRLPVFLACALALGAFLGCLFEFYNINGFWLLPVTLCLLAAVIVFFSANKSLKPALIIVFALIFFVIGATGCVSRLKSYAEDELGEKSSSTLYIEGTVKEKSGTANGEYLIITNAYADGNKLHSDICVYLGDAYGEYCDVGYFVKFYTKLNSYDAFAYGKLNYRVENNVKYYCNVYGGLKSQYHFSLFGEIRSAFRKTLFDNLDYDTAAVCYGMLVGETFYIDDAELTNFRYGGIAHIFAVSGLHIGIIFGLLSFILKKLKANKFVAAAACIAVSVFYAGICGFTVSSVRAVIMCSVHAVCKLIHVKSDGLNSLSFAVIIILCINPLSLFSVGFQLSVCAMGGIYIFSRGFARTLGKIRLPEKSTEKIPDGKFKKFINNLGLPKKLCFALGTSFAAQAGTLPVMLASFGYVSGAGLLLNVIIIPVISALFAVIFFSVIFSAMVAPAAAFIMPVATAPLEAIVSFLVSYGFEKALISGFGAGLFIPLYYVAALAASDKLNLKAIKRAVAVVCSAVILATFVLANTYLPFNGYKIAVSAFNGGGDVIIKSSQGTVLIITDYANPSYVLSDINEYYASKLDGVIILGGEDCVNEYNKLDLNCKNVYACLLYLDLQPYDGVQVHYEKDFNLCGISFEFVDGYTITAKCGGVKTAVCANENIPVESCDLLISLYPNAECKSDYTVYFNLHGYKNSVYDYGDFVFYAKDGELKLSKPHKIN